MVQASGWTWTLPHSHTFVFDREHPNVMKMKLMPDNSNQDATELNILKLGVTIQTIQDAYQHLVMPPVLIPSGLSAQWSQYLYNKVREYVRDPRKKDGFCPKPSLAINLSSAAENVCAQDHQQPFLAHPLLKVMRLMMKTKAGNADQILN